MMRQKERQTERKILDTKKRKLEINLGTYF